MQAKVVDMIGMWYTIYEVLNIVAETEALVSIMAMVLMVGTVASGIPVGWWRL